MLLGNMELNSVFKRARSRRARVGIWRLLLHVNRRSRSGSSSRARELMQALKESASVWLKRVLFLSEVARSRLKSPMRSQAPVTFEDRSRSS